MPDEVKPAPPAIDHETFLAGLDVATRAGLQERSDARGLLHLAGHACAIMVTGALIHIRVPAWPLLIPVHGILLAFLFTLEHECTHRTPFRNGAINEWTGRICGFVILLPFTWFRYFHLAHHKYTNVPGRDPELLSGQKPETPAALLRHLSGIPTWTGNAGTLLRNAFLEIDDGFVPDRAKPAVRREARTMLAAYAALAGAAVGLPLDLLFVWLIPLIVGQPFLRFYLLAEHGRCPFASNMFENTRTTLTTRAIRLLAWNMPYHAEHHALPNVPFHRLPDLHALAFPHLRKVEKGYLRFARRYAASLDR